jgi:hypothetical protein
VLGRTGKGSVGAIMVARPMSVGVKVWVGGMTSVGVVDAGGGTGVSDGVGVPPVKNALGRSERLQPNKTPPAISKNRVPLAFVIGVPFGPLLV